MNIWKFVRCGISIAVLLNQGPTQQSIVAAEPTKPTAPLSLETLVAEVVERNPEITFYIEEIAAAKGLRRTSGAWSNPEITTSIGQKSIRSDGLSREGTAWSASISQPLEWPGRIPLRKAIANRQLHLAELGLAQFKAMLAFKTRVLAHNLASAQERAAAADEVAGRFQQLREVLVQRDPAGLTPLLETRIIEATELTLKRKAAEAAQSEHVALLQLNQLRGNALDQPLKLQRLQFKFAPLPGLAVLMASALTNNFEIQMRQVELEEQGFKVQLAKKERYPNLSIAPYFSQETAGDRERQAGIGLSLPLPLWNRNNGNVETASARLKQAETLLLISRRELEMRIAENSFAYQTRLKEMSQWRGDSAAEFQKAAELADRHYRLGAVPISTYVELQKQYLEAVEALLETRREALEAAQEIQRLTGMDLEIVTESGGAK